MGKKGRRTRWRTLTIASDELSDSEESNTTSSGHRSSAKPYSHPHQKSFYGRFTYNSSQSTPIRRHHHHHSHPYDAPKSTRSSSTASENKITFNEDEYTRITTPRQDVLFKKGYLNKPRTYQTQTSTGTSTTSTGNSTGNGTPDHQSTDLEYESQFVFPNGFVDQNGIYYVNSFEPYPLMVFNPPTYYQEFSDVKTKRSSTGSLTESTSPNNEEASQSETPSNVSADFPSHYNVIYPGFYFNGACPPQDAEEIESDPRRLKKRRRRKPSHSKSPSGSTSDYSDESSDEVFSDDASKLASTEDTQPLEVKEPSKTDQITPQKLLLQSLMSKDQETPPITTTTTTTTTTTVTEEKEQNKEQPEEDTSKSKYDLKPDAEEFVPMAYRAQPSEQMIQVLDPNLQYIKMPPNFVPVPILNPMGEFNGQNFNAFIPPGIPFNFIPPNYVNYVPNYEEDAAEEELIEDEERIKHQENKVAESEVNLESSSKDEVQNCNNNVNNSTSNASNQIDIAKIVSKLEEAVEKRTDEAVNSNNKIQQQQRERNCKSFNNIRKQPQRNYSETLLIKKKPSQTSREHIKDSPTIKPSVTNKPEHVNNRVKKVEESSKSPRNSQWISVSSRKKRKNKNVEEEFETFDEHEDKESDLFESYDVNLLEDVIPNNSSNAKSEEVVEVKVDEAVEVVEMVEEKAKVSKKKSKNKNKNKITKRVIIKDIDLSIEPMTDEVVVKDKEEDVVVPEVVKEESVVSKKANKNKKKKKVKNLDLVSDEVMISHQSSSNLTLDDSSSYDFLLESSLLDESLEEKTNLEVSQELDKMIQRGMYSNLEEKMKSLNMETNENFFKSIINNISSRESSVEKNSYSKNPDLTKILESTTQLLKPKSVFLEPVKGTIITPCSSNNFLGESPALDVGGAVDYPITSAVKEWMTKIREKTPDIELLKSPSTIFREFCTEEDDEVSDCYDSRENSVEIDDYVIEEKKSAGNLNFPKPGNLPYRAICCSIM